MFAGRRNNTLLCLYQRISLGIPKGRVLSADWGCLLPELFSVEWRQVAGQNQVTCFQGTLEASEKDGKIVTLLCGSIIQVLTTLFVGSGQHRIFFFLSPTEYFDC